MAKPGIVLGLTNRNRVSLWEGGEGGILRKSASLGSDWVELGRFGVTFGSVWGSPGVWLLMGLFGVGLGSLLGHFGAFRGLGVVLGIPSFGTISTRIREKRVQADLDSGTLISDLFPTEFGLVRAYGPMIALKMSASCFPL